MVGAIIWSWQVFGQYLFSGEILHGAWVTIWLTAAGIGLGTCIGAVLSVFGTSEKRLSRVLYQTYTGIVRGIPLLVTLVLVYDGLPQFGLTFGVVQSTLIALAINESAYMAEIIRGGILSVPHGQMEAAKALGMHRTKAMRVVILPQAIRAAIPAAGNEVNGLLKSTSLVSVISMTELFRVTQDVYAVNFHPLELLTIASLYYLTMGTAWRGIQSLLERRFGAPTSSKSRMKLRRPSAQLVAMESS